MDVEPLNQPAKIAKDGAIEARSSKKNGDMAQNLIAIGKATWAAEEGEKIVSNVKAD